MTDPAMQPAQPPRPRRRSPSRQTITVQSGTVATAMEFLDRYGISTLLLLGMAYAAHTTIVQPIASEYQQMVKKVGENSELLRQEVQANDAADTERVLAMQRATDKLQSILDEVQSIGEKNEELNRQILDGLAVNRAINRTNQNALNRIAEKLLGRPAAVLEDEDPPGPFEQDK